MIPKQISLMHSLGWYFIHCFHSGQFWLFPFTFIFSGNKGPILLIQFFFRDHFCFESEFWRKTVPSAAITLIFLWDYVQLYHFPIVRSRFSTALCRVKSICGHVASTCLKLLPSSSSWLWLEISLKWTWFLVICLVVVCTFFLSSVP